MTCAKTDDVLGPISHFFISQRLRLHYVDWGNETAPPLLLIHGGRDHCRTWDFVAEELRHDWHVIAPDLRGHGDSQWLSDGNYSLSCMIYDLAQLIHQQQLAPVTIIGHSLGGNIAVRYSGIYPENVLKLVNIEGLGPSPAEMEMRSKTGFDVRMRDWIAAQRSAAGRSPRRYKSIEEAFERMQKVNARLSPDKARHLTLHGVNQNEDGTYSWKFDPYISVSAADELPQTQVERLWANVDCAVLLVYGSESWASNPAKDGRVRPFRNAKVELIAGAGHWIHHDQPKAFVDVVKSFLG